MSFAATCYWTLARSLLLALAAWPVCHVLERGLRASARPRIWMLLLASPFLLPELLVGYLLAPFVAGQPWRSEPACAALLFLRSAPIGAIALWGMPASPVSSLAIHVRRLSVRDAQSAWELARCYWLGPVRRALPALGLMFLVTFQEFEASALLGTVSWTDWLFTEYATGLALAESGRYLMLPLIIQAVVLLIVGWSLWNRGAASLPDSSPDEEASVGPMTRRLTPILAGSFFFFGAALPLIILSPKLIQGWTWLMSQSTLWQSLAAEMLTPALVGLVAGLAAWNLARIFVSDPCPVWLPAFCSLPGMCGGLTVCLAVVWLSQRAPLHLIYDTPIPWVFALVLWLLPRAWLLQLWLQQETSPAGWHLVRLLRNSPAVTQQNIARKWWWDWRIEPQLAACGLLCYWAYLDVTSAKLLAPTAMASVMVRLYDFMHFGRTAALSMEATLAMFLPVALWFACISLARAGRWGWSR